MTCAKNLAGDRRSHPNTTQSSKQLYQYITVVVCAYRTDKSGLHGIE